DSLSRLSPPAVKRPFGARKSSVNRPSLLRDVAVPRVDQAVERVRDEAGGGDAEQQRAVRVVREPLQRAVEPDGLLRVVLDGGLDREDADQREDDEARDVPGDAGAPAPRLRGVAAVDPLVLELARQPAVEVPEADADGDDGRRADEPAAGRPGEDGRRRLVRLLGLRLRPACTGDDPGRAVREAEVDRRATEVADPLRP